MRTNLFADPKNSIRRAKKHIHDLDRAIGLWIKKKPYTITVKPKFIGGYIGHKFRMKKLPQAFTDMATDASYNLRAALDQAAHTSARALSRTGETKYTYFPFASTQAGLENVIRGQCKHLHPDIVAFLRRLDPYKGGNNLLWAINKIAVTNKHCVVTPPQFTANNFVVGTRGPGPFRSSLKWDSREHNVKFCLISKSASYCHMAIPLIIDLDDIGPLSERPVIGLLDDMVSVVEGIVAGIEAETRRISSLSE